MRIKSPIYNDRLPRPSRGSLSNWRNGFWPLALLITALYAIMSYVTPFAIDDWVFMGNYRDNCNNGSLDFSFPAWIRFYEFTRSYDNGRLSNFFSPISTLFSPWKELFPILTGIMAAVMAVLTQKLANRHPSTLFLALTWVLMIFSLPWRDTIFVRDYSLNYIWAAAINLYFICLLLKVETKGHRRSAAFKALLIFFAILTGGWHEGFAFATLGGIGLLMVLRRFRLSATFYAAAAVLLVSTMLFMFSPGLSGRMVDSFATKPFAFSYRLNLIFILAIFLLLVSIFSKSGRTAVATIPRYPTIIIFIGIMIAGYALYVLFERSPRVVFWPCLGAVGFSLYLLHGLFYPLLSSHRVLTAILSVLLTALSAAQMIYTIVWQAKYTRETEDIMELLYKSKTGTVFYDSKLPLEAPPFALRIPTSHLWRSNFHCGFLMTYVNDKEIIGVVPTALKDYRPGDGEPVEGVEGARLYKGHIVTPKMDVGGWKLDIPRFTDTDFTLPDGTHIQHPMVAIPFITERNDTLVYFTDY